MSSGLIRQIKCIRYFIHEKKKVLDVRNDRQGM